MAATTAALALVHGTGALSFSIVFLTVDLVPGAVGIWA